MSKRLFVATSFSKKVNYETGQVLPEFRAETEAILKALRNSGELVVFCAIEYEGWVVSDESPDVGVAEDLRQIEKSDVLLALLIDRPSEGLRYEMGYAGALGKLVVMATPAQLEPGYFNKGLANLERVIHIIYTTPEQLAEQISKTLPA